MYFQANLAVYEKWSSSAHQADTWLGDLLLGCCIVDIEPGQTMMIPSMICDIYVYLLYVYFCIFIAHVCVYCTGIDNMYNTV